MDAKPTRELLVAGLIAALVGMTSAEEPPLPFPMDGEPRALEDLADLAELAQPATVRGADDRERIRDAFAIDPEQAASRAPRQSQDVRVASASADSPRGHELLALYAQAERAAGRGRSLSDLTDLIELCERTAATLAAGDRAAADRLTSWAYNRRGERLHAAGKPHQAFADFQHAIVLDDRNAAALHNRAVTLAQHGKPEEALADFHRAVALRPTDPTYRRNRAELLAGRGEWQAALRDYAAAFKHGAADASLYSSSGFCQARLGRQALALRDYHQALAISPHDAQTLALRGALFAEAGYYEQATADLSAALAADPSSAAAYQSVAWLLATCPDESFRDEQKALEAARRARRFGDADDPLLLDVLAAAHASAGQLGEAVRLQQQAAMLAPQEMRLTFEHRLELYRAGRAYREPAKRVAVSSGAFSQSR